MYTLLNSKYTMPKTKYFIPNAKQAILKNKKLNTLTLFFFVRQSLLQIYCIFANDFQASKWYALESRLPSVSFQSTLGMEKSARFFHPQGTHHSWQ